MWAGSKTVFYRHTYAIIMKKVSTVLSVNITEQVLTEPIPETLKTLYEGTQMFQLLELLTNPVI